MCASERAMHLPTILTLSLGIRKAACCPGCECGCECDSIRDNRSHEIAVEMLSERDCYSILACMIHMEHCDRLVGYVDTLFVRYMQCSSEEM